MIFRAMISTGHGTSNPERIIVIPYDPAWLQMFQEERRKIIHTLGTNVIAIHHMGSTAIPGMAAKPVIDILVEVKDLKQLDSQAGKMQKLGYEAMGERGIAGRRFFRKRNLLGVRTHHVHAYQVGNPQIEQELAFRDYLIAHPSIAHEYGRLKQELALAHPDDRQAYAQGKDSFIQSQITRAVYWKRERSK
jgi:GrpB-like predicted nucleotidyltransferase (UPF0157 family)